LNALLRQGILVLAWRARRFSLRPPSPSAQTSNSSIGICKANGVAQGCVAAAAPVVVAPRAPVAAASAARVAYAAAAPVAVSHVGITRVWR
jgi:hypothetical protein